MRVPQPSRDVSTKQHEITVYARVRNHLVSFLGKRTAKTPRLLSMRSPQPSRSRQNTFTRDYCLCAYRNHLETCPLNSTRLLSMRVSATISCLFYAGAPPKLRDYCLCGHPQPSRSRSVPTHSCTYSTGAPHNCRDYCLCGPPQPSRSRNVLIYICLTLKVATALRLRKGCITTSSRFPVAM